jgi:hypothetical protein
MHPLHNKTSLLLLPPITIDTFTKAVPDLITYFEGLDTTIEELSSSPSSSPSSSSTSNMSRAPAPFPSPFSALRLSLTTSFNHPKRAHHTDPSTDSTTVSTTTSASTSPQSSLRGSAFPRSRTYNTTPPRTRYRSRSPQSTMSSYTNSPVLLSRRPSAIDLALLEEESLSQNIKGFGLGLGLMEPRPVVPVAVAAPVGTGSILEASLEAEVEQRQPFVMGGILEVMEGRS